MKIFLELFKTCLKWLLLKATTTDKIVLNLSREINVVIALDEADLLLRTFPEQFPSADNSTNAHAPLTRSLLSPVRETLSNLARLIIAGTHIGLRNIDTVISGVLKQNQHCTISNFRFNSIEDTRNLCTRIFQNLSPEELTKISTSLYGRSRFLLKFAYTIETATEKSVLELLISFIDDIAVEFRSRLNILVICDLGGTIWDRIEEMVLRAILCDSYLDSHTKSDPISSIFLDWVGLGFAHAFEIKNSFYILAEPIVLSVLLEGLREKNRSPALYLAKKVASIANPQSRGYFFEDICALSWFLLKKPPLLLQPFISLWPNTFQIRKDVSVEDVLTSPIPTILLPEFSLGPDLLIFIPGADFLILMADKTSQNEHVDPREVSKNYDVVRLPSWLTQKDKKNKDHRVEVNPTRKAKILKMLSHIRTMIILHFHLPSSSNDSYNATKYKQQVSVDEKFLFEYEEILFDFNLSNIGQLSLFSSDVLHELYHLFPGNRGKSPTPTLPIVQNRPKYNLNTKTPTFPGPTKRKKMEKKETTKRAKIADMLDFLPKKTFFV